MSTYSEHINDKKPIRTFVLPKSAWSTDYAKRPGGDVAIGLRLLGDLEIQTIRSESAREAVKAFMGLDGKCIDEDTRNEAYNAALIRLVAGRSATDPNDVTRSYFETQESMVGYALTPEGARRIFDEYDTMLAGTSPLMLEATEKHITEIASLFRRVDQLPAHQSKRVRRLLHAALEELRTLKKEP